MKVKTAQQEEPKQPLLVGEVAKALDLTVQALHFYERQGLVVPHRTQKGYRLYTKEMVDRVRFIRKAKGLCFSLEEIKEIFALARPGSSPCGRVQASLAEKLHEVDRRLAALQDFRTELAFLIEEAQKTSTRKPMAQVCSIVEQAAPLPLTSITKPALARKRREKRL
jgi:MerR family transcriptional regulator, copper efflux regulator